MNQEHNGNDEENDYVIYEVKLDYHGSKEELKQWMKRTPFSVDIRSVERVEIRDPSIFEKLYVIIKWGIRKRIQNIRHMIRKK